MLCWNIIITNQSESRTALIAYAPVVNDDLRPEDYYNFTDVRDEQTKAKFPIIFDGGDARRLQIRAPTKVSEMVATIVDKFVKQHQETTKLKIQDLLPIMGAAGIDFNGNEYHYLRADMEMRGINFDQTFARVRFETGRGNYFIANLGYP